MGNELLPVIIATIATGAAVTVIFLVGLIVAVRSMNRCRDARAARTIARLDLAEQRIIARLDLFEQQMIARRNLSEQRIIARLDLFEQQMIARRNLAEQRIIARLNAVFSS